MHSLRSNSRRSRDTDAGCADKGCGRYRFEDRERAGKEEKEKKGEGIDKEIKEKCEWLADVVQMMKDEGELTAKEAKYIVNRITEVQVLMLMADRAYDAKQKKEAYA